MSVLSAQSIRMLCTNLDHIRRAGGPLLVPFVERGVIRGRSYGLSSCTYDLRISDSLLLPVGQGRLAATIERFKIPTNVCGLILDKSSWARVFVTAFNTFLDPGWEGYLTVELFNLGTEAIRFQTGDPVCQVLFQWLDLPTDLPYQGKYQNQGEAPTPAIHEGNLL